MNLAEYTAGLLALRERAAELGLDWETATIGVTRDGRIALTFQRTPRIEVVDEQTPAN